MRWSTSILYPRMSAARPLDRRLYDGGDAQGREGCLCRVSEKARGRKEASVVLITAAWRPVPNACSSRISLPRAGHSGVDAARPARPRRPTASDARGPAQHLADLPAEDRIDRVMETLHRRTTADLSLLREELAAPTSLLFLYPFSPEFSKPRGYERGRIL